jgi:hypothetical protein
MRGADAGLASATHMWNSLKDILPGVAGKFQIKRTLDAIDVCREYRRIAPGMLPKDVLSNTFAKSYKDFILTIAVGNPAWAQEIHMRRHLLKDEINKKYNDNIVKNVRIIITDEPISEIEQVSAPGPDPGPNRPNPS